jgi:protein gp37
MADNTKIQWTDHTWNPWHGCIKVSPGCKLCYMYTEKKMYGQDPTKVVRSKTKFDDPLKWKEPAMVFTCSWSDFFIEQADEWRPEAWEIIKRTPHLTYQVLTKRPERIADHLPHDWGTGYKNVWLGVSAENQDYAEERIPRLLSIPAVIRFVSAEPLLGPIDLDTPDSGGLHATGCGGPCDCAPKLDWVIVGGESGHGARTMQIQWAESLLDQCATAGVAFFLKQFGAKPETNNLPIIVTKKGGDPQEWPEYLRVRQFPEVRA